MKRLIAGLSLLAVAAVCVPGVQAAGAEKTFLIPANDGYGVAECLTGTGACGKVVADAWCEAQGFAAAASYGPAANDEYTGAIASVPAPRSAKPIRVTCQD